MGKLRCKVGNTVYCLEKFEDIGFEVGGYLFLATCKDYVIVSSHYLHCKNIEEQLEEMAEESLEYSGVSLCIFHRDNVFATKEEAEAALARMEKDDGKIHENSY